MGIKALYKKHGTKDQAKSLAREPKMDSWKSHNCLKEIGGSAPRNLGNHDIPLPWLLVLCHATFL